MKKRLLATVIGGSSLIGAFIASASSLLYFQHEKSTSHKSELHEIAVTFDTARYLNSRRASMASLIAEAESGNMESNPVAVIQNVDKFARQAIERIASGRLVVVRQALALDKQVPDITEQVITELGLPLVEATVSIPDIDNMANNYSTSDLYELAKKTLFEKNKKAIDGASQAKKELIQDANAELLP